MTTATDKANEEGQTKAVRVYILLIVVLSLFGIGMLGCGIVATRNIDDETFGPLYFIGGYVVGIMALLSALMCTCVVSKAEDAISNVKKLEAGNAMMCHYMLSMLMLMGSGLSVVFACIDRFLSPEDMSPLNKDLAIVILSGNLLGFLISVASMCTVCTYGKYFGIVIRKVRRENAVIIHTNNTTAPMGGVHTTATMFQSGHVYNAELNQLKMQNQLLQQQLKLQKLLNQQQQYGGGFSPQAPPPPMYNAPPPPVYNAPPPPVYNARSAYPPPPSYNHLK